MHVSCALCVACVASVLFFRTAALADSHPHSSPSKEEKQYHFPLQCDAAAYGALSPNSSLPVEVGISGVTPSLEEFEHAYSEGFKQCTDFIERNETHKMSHASKKLFEEFGMLLWMFGPRYCPTHSKCWFGLLTCGIANEHFLFKSYVKSNTKRQHEKMELLNAMSPYVEHQPFVFIDTIPSFLGWSLRALISQSRVDGREIITPTMKLLTTPLSSRKVAVEALIGEYVSTIPGSSVIETQILSLYPGLLFNFSALEKQEGKDLLHPVRLFSVNAANISVADITPATSMPVTFAYGGLKCATAAATAALPYCRGGANPGRWIKLPASIAEDQCNITATTHAIANILNYQVDKRTYRIRIQAYKNFTARYYRKHASVGNYTELWKPVTEVSNNWATDYKVYMAELGRYASGPVCSLAFTEPSTALDRDRLSIFAPYMCRYRIFGSGEAQQCLIRSHIARPLIFHGDSVSAMLLHQAQLLLNAPAMSPEEKKKITHLYVKNGKNLKQLDTSRVDGVDIITISEDTWMGITNPWDGPSPYVLPPFLFMSDYALYHITHLNMTAFAQAIFQSASSIRLEHNAEQGVEAYSRRIRILREHFLAAGFVEMDAWYLTSAALSNYDIHYDGCPRKMVNHILFNIMCNQEYRYSSSVSSAVEKHQKHKSMKNKKKFLASVL